MAILDAYITNLDRIKDQLEQIAQRAVKENADLIIHTLTHGQLAKGLDSNNNIIGRYSPYTSLVASDPSSNLHPSEPPKRRGQPYNMQWSMELFETMTLRSERDSFSIFSTTGKAKFLEGIYDRKLTALTEKNNNIIN